MLKSFLVDPAEGIPRPVLACSLRIVKSFIWFVRINRTDQDRTEQDRTEQSRAGQKRRVEKRREEKRTEQHRTEQRLLKRLP
jgi:hypothetical protein